MWWTVAARSGGSFSRLVFLGSESFSSRAPLPIERAGRAGRVGEGHCYRLFSPAVFAKHMEDFAPVEITQVALDQPLLFMGSLGITDFIKFPRVTRPLETAVKSGVRRLQALGAFASGTPLSVTFLGRAIATLPVAPRHGLILLRAARQPEILSVACAAVAGLTVGELFEEPAPPKCGWRTSPTDIDAIVWAVCASMCTQTSDQFCQEHGLRARAVGEAVSLAQQLWATAVLPENDKINRCFVPLIGR